MLSRDAAEFCSRLKQILNRFIGRLVCGFARRQASFLFACFHQLCIQLRVLLPEMEVQIRCVAHLCGNSCAAYFTLRLIGFPLSSA